jgi:NAD(P)-dependent dehydrogenase (short-subunit alcohol dehydrogenase family)
MRLITRRAAIAFVASPASDFVTGQTFVLDSGGMMT